MKKLFFILSAAILTTFGSCVPAHAQNEKQQIFVGTATGTDTYTVTIESIQSPTLLDGKEIGVAFTNPNTGASTITVINGNGKSYGAKSIYLNGAALTAGILNAEEYYALKYQSSSGRWNLKTSGGSVAGTPLIRGTNTYTAATSINPGANLTINTGSNDFRVVCDDYIDVVAGNYTATITGDRTVSCDDHDSRMTGNIVELIDDGATWTRTVNGSTGNAIMSTAGTYSVYSAGAATIGSPTVTIPNARTTTQSENDNSTKVATTAYVDKGILIYEAILTQTGTNAPSASVYVNTLGGSIVWTRDGVGLYTGTLSNAFPASRTAFILSPPYTLAGLLLGGRGSVNTVKIESLDSAGAHADDAITETTIIIKVYPDPS